MKSLLVLLNLVLFSTCSSQSLSPVVRMTPIADLALQSSRVIVPERYKNEISGNLSLSLPHGYTAKIFHAGGLSKPRFFAWSPDSVLHVADKSRGEIIALPDKNFDGVADNAIVVASGFRKPHDLKFYNGAMYVAEETQVSGCIDANGDGIYEKRSTFVSMVTGGQQGGGGHDTRTIVFDPQKKKMYLSIGSQCNACREESRAIIEEWNDDGTGRRVFATGCRNAIGMTMRNGKLWATNNGFDWQGDDIPPEWIDIVRDGGFYGYPYAYAHGVWVDFSKPGGYGSLLPLTALDSAKVRSMVQPATLVQAHSAPMAIEFSNHSFPQQFRNGAFVAYRGSWNRNEATGFKVVYIDFNDINDTTANSVADFVGGFLTGSSGRSAWGRPVGLETDTRGNLYISSDDITECIIIVSAVGKK
ncbi:MAG: PQQ-dependent sugar dehydrogenase [Ignavibacteriales bacterium]|nr:PQQ-dependent sugar dehydrogenase [Ignavibacteriales bacterium]